MPALWLRLQTDGEPTPFDDLEVTFLEPGSAPGNLLDTSYLNEEAALVEFDDEGQIRLAGAASVTEFYAAEVEEEHSFDDDFCEENGLLDPDGDLDGDALHAKVVELVRAAGYTGDLRRMHDWKYPPVDIDPEDFHAERYRAHGGGA